MDRLRQQEEIFISDEIAEKLKKISPKPLPSFKTSKTGSLPEKKVPSKENPLIYQKIQVKAGGWDRTLPGQV